MSKSKCITIKLFPQSQRRARAEWRRTNNGNNDGRRLLQIFHRVNVIHLKNCYVSLHAAYRAPHIHFVILKLQSMAISALPSLLLLLLLPLLPLLWLLVESFVKIFVAIFFFFFLILFWPAFFPTKKFMCIFQGIWINRITRW